MGKKTTRKHLARKFLRGAEPSAILAGLDRVVSQRHTAELLNISYHTLRRGIRTGVLRLPVVHTSEKRIGHRLSDIYALIEEHTEKSGGLAVRHHHGPPSPSLA
jgi:hypothetical protein